MTENKPEMRKRLHERHYLKTEQIRKRNNLFKLALRISSAHVAEMRLVLHFDAILNVKPEVIIPRGDGRKDEVF